MNTENEWLDCKLPKKRRKAGRIQDVMKKIKLSTHEQGDPCFCKRLRCFENVDQVGRKSILEHFNSMTSNNEQNSYLCGLISVIPIQRRRSRKPEQDAVYHDSSYSYRVRVKREDQVVEIPVCFKAFCSIHGVTKGKVEYLQKSLKSTGNAPKDKRGGHTSYKKMSDNTYNKVFNPIDSFQGRLSHYSLHDSKKLYLPEELNIKKMYSMFKEKNPSVQISYETYRMVFNTKFNISFGYPRSDTCSACDEFMSNLNRLKKDGNSETEIRRLEVENELHKRGAQTFYDRKKDAKKKAKTTSTFAAIAMDYQKNIYIPNITTNDVCYLRQLSLYSFNIHVLASGMSLFYTYPEHIAKKGSEEVCSFLFDFIMNHLENTVKHLHIFCDSAGGQNKNYTMFRFMHFIVHTVKRLDCIQITFPIRRHSYLECDKNMGHINLKTRMEIPEDWYQLLRESRINPFPFTFIEVNQNMIKNWIAFFKEIYSAKCPFAVQSIKEIYCSKEHSRLMTYRITYNGHWQQSPLINNKKRKQNTSTFDHITQLKDNEFELPKASYNERAPIINEGLCPVGFCKGDAACKQYSNNTYTCLCPHDSLPPTLDGRCPTRFLVPLEPTKIKNILPPQINDSKSQLGLNKTFTLVQTTTLPTTEKPIFTQDIPISSAAGVSVLIVCVVLLVWWKARHCSSRNTNSTTPSPIVLKRSLLLADRYAPNPQYSACVTTTVPLLKRENLIFLHEIGEGCFGKVYKGQLISDSKEYPDIVAIKVLKESPTLEAEEDFFREVDIMSAFKHNNILSLLGVVSKEENPSPMMVFEYMPHGDLAEVLRSQKKRLGPEDRVVPIFSTKDLLSIALQIASGMKYLAAQRFVHRDLACRNCLVADGPTVKIADFGMSRDVYTCDYYKVGGSRLLPVRWMSPESVMYGRFTLESDIWSYGIVLWEIYSFAKQPYYGHTNEEVVKLILQGIMLIPPDDCPTLVCELMQNCWKTEPRDRIRFTDIYDKLEKSYENFEEIVVENNDKLKIENECSRTNTLKKLPRPPPLHIVPKLDLLDADGYLLPNEIKEPVQYLETLPD